MAIATALSHGPGFNDTDGSSGYLFIALTQVLVFIVGGIAVLRWVYFANANARAMGAEGMNGTPALAVAWYFIPLANLAMPFQTMRETWKASVNPKDWEVEKAPALLGFWWACWLIGNITGLAAFRLDDPEQYPEAGHAVEALITTSDAFTIGGSILLAMIIGRITEMQRAKA